MKRMFKSITNLIPIIQIIFSIILMFILSSLYIMVTTRNLPFSLILGVITGLLAFYFVVYIPKQVKRKQFLYKELQKYATNMTFYLQTGQNILRALQLSKQKLDPEIQKDIDKTIQILRDEAILEVDHFKKYGFSSLNIFHQILRIKYEVGGNAKDLFSKVNQSINFEIVKRDELFRRKNYIKKKIYMMMAMALAIPLILVFMAEELYNTFLTMGGIAIGLNVILFTVILINLVFLQRTSNDISLQ